MFELCGRMVGGKEPLFVIAGPCVIESREHALRCADEIASISKRLGVQIIYKSSFDKANRTSLSSFRGVGIDEGLEILSAVKDRTGLPVLTDVHTPEQAPMAAEVVDVLQTPAFLARQTDFIVSVAKCGKPVNIKKAQFMAPSDMRNVVDKARSTGNQKIMLCERGTKHGYGDLVVDMRGLQVMADTGQPVVFDATHSVQLMGAKGDSSGGERRFVPTLAKAAVATGIAGVFMETHPDPDHAPCDGPNAWPLQHLESLVTVLMNLDRVAKHI